MRWFDLHRKIDIDNTLGTEIAVEDQILLRSETDINTTFSPNTGKKVVNSSLLTRVRVYTSAVMLTLTLLGLQSRVHEASLLGTGGPVTVPNQNSQGLL